MGRLTTHIARVFIDQLPRKGPRVVVSDINAGTGVLERYLAWRRFSKFLVSTSPVLIVRSSALSSPDDIKVLAARRTGDEIRVVLDLRHYSGVLLGNEITAALIEVELGHLSRRQYAVTIETALKEFDQLGGKDEAIDCGRTVYRTTIHAAPMSLR